MPPGFEYYTPEQQAQFYQAMSATSGPVFTYLLPAVMALLGVYLGWLVLGWVLHLILTMLGGRGSSRQVLNVAAWASLPFAIRSVVRIAAMWNSGQLLTYLGLSGFAPANDGALVLYLSSLLTHVDLYLFWFILLLGIGVRTGENLARFKGWTAVLLTVIFLTLLRAVPALLAAQFSDVTVIRPFF
ncbi:MAG: YIP1 family protein [Ardenticatenaceae bacterium]|nr:YIP1 family protein [Ardenticatenaceae bacterium]